MTLLKEYYHKRNFKKTPEPLNKHKGISTHHLYVIQKHAASHLHYDFRLEMEGVLKSWAVPKGPSLNPHIKRLAVHVEDHPLAYGSFEGIIPKGEYGGGTVVLWDRGTWESEKSPIESYKKGDITFILKGEKLKGAWKLLKIKSDPKNWLLIKISDKFASNTEDILTQKPWSVLSRTKMPVEIYPELATLVDSPPKGKNWLHELKYDGYRLICFIKNNDVQLITRNQHNWTHKFPALVNNIKKLNLKNAILDGEIVALDKENKANFQLLQNNLKSGMNIQLIYYAFDIVYHDDNDLSKTPLIDRKKILRSIIPENDTSIIRYSDYIIDKGETVFKEACKFGLEGIVSKEITSEYVQKRTRQWLKSKCVKRQEFIVGGYTLPKGKREYFGSLLIGYYNDNKLEYCGHVGTGFTEKSLGAMYTLLKKYKNTKMPFNKTPPLAKNVNWTRPQIVIEVEYSEKTTDGILRHPSFKGIRKDKSPKEIILETPKKSTSYTENSNAKTITHPDRVFYPEQGITKQDLINFYEKISSWILPYVINRPLTLVRCPEGWKKTCFYQKHATATSVDNIHLVDITEKSGTRKYVYIQDIAGLIELIQMGVLEIHPWGCHVDNIEKPDMIIFDLDPGLDVPWKQVIDTAFFIREKLLELNLTSFVKTSGGKGLHVVIPIQPQLNWDEIKSFAHAFAKLMVKLNPEQYTSVMKKEERKGKIFIDYLRNGRGATAIAPYSTRARENAPVSTPLRWDELTVKIHSTSYTVKNLISRLKRLKKDPWEGFFSLKQKIVIDSWS